MRLLRVCLLASLMAPALLSADPAAPVPAADPPARTLDELLARVRAAHSGSASADVAREKVFVEERERQQSRLDAARLELAGASQRASSLEQRFESTQRTLVSRQAELQSRLGALGAVFRHLGEQGAELQPLLRDSVISTQVGAGRLEALDQLLQDAASGERLPRAEALESFWFELQRELAESGAVRRFEAPVRAPDGSDAPRSVVRVGGFAAIDTAGHYLLYRGEDARFLELPAQPDGDIIAVAADFAAATEGVQPFVLDPTGATGARALQDAIAAPGFGERLSAGGLPGWLALLMGLAGAALAVWRLVHVERWNTALRAGVPLPADHPVMQLRAVAAAHPTLDATALEHLLHEALLRAMPAIEFGLSALRLTVTAAPLLGVLGTVSAVMHGGVPGQPFDPETLLRALAATVEGLAAGLAVLLLQSLLAARVRLLVHALDQEAAALVAAAAIGDTP
jgi:biopolymer transport protein ExbB